MWIKQRPARPGPPASFPEEEARLRRWIDELAVPRHIFKNAASNARVRERLIETFESLGLEVEVQGVFQNVVAMPGTKAPVTIVAAHYDSVPDCPGADDNGSGVAVMLELARALRDRDRPVGFIGFNAEEDGLLGSRDFVKNGAGLLRAPIRGAHVLEMVGFRKGAPRPQKVPLPFAPAGLEIPDYIGLLAKGPSNPIVDEVVALGAAPSLRILGAKTWGPLHKAVPDLMRSDHFPFWMADVPAVMWTDTANFRNPNYHRRSDTPETLDYAFMREITQLLTALLDRPL
jgi:Zn-dependent M28 family amino/carboxypeptidase